MYTVQLCGDILTVTERHVTFYKTSIIYWKYSIQSWKRTITGKEEEIPAATMTEQEIQWVVKHYIPKINKGLS